MRLLLSTTSCHQIYHIRNAAIGARHQQAWMQEKQYVDAAISLFGTYGRFYKAYAGCSSRVGVYEPQCRFLT